MKETYKLHKKIHNSPLKGIGVRDIIIILGDFNFFLLFAIGCESKFREILAYLEVGSSDLEPIHEKNHFHEISDIFMKSRIYSWVKFKKSNHKNALEAHFCDLISGKTISDIFMGNLGYIHG